MNDTQTFEGDLLLESTPDGGDVQVEDGFFLCDRTFSTAVYLSLFGGNKDDNGKVANDKTWWGNTLPNATEGERLVSRFQTIIFGLPMTTKTIREAEEAAKLDLAWLKNSGAADEVAVSGYATGHENFELHVNVMVGGESLYSNIFSLQWREGVYGGL